MSHLPVLSGRRVVKVFESFGWQVARGTLRVLIRLADLTVHQFVRNMD